MNTDKIGIIGYGNMGGAICERLKNSYPLIVFDKDTDKLKDLSNIKVADNNFELVDASDVIILAVKPQDFDSLLQEIKNNIKDKLVISIAAGITTNYIERILGNVKVIRVMPNMPAKIGKGMTCLCKGRFASDKNLNFAKGLFDKLGKTLILKEEMMDAATAISGSGPGYFYDFMEDKDINEIKKLANNEFIPELTEAAQSIGFTLEQAKLLVNQSIRGSITMIQNTKATPLELKKQITSKGGTTEAALEVLHKGSSLKEAVKAALKRAKELSK